MTARNTQLNLQALRQIQEEKALYHETEITEGGGSDEAVNSSRPPMIRNPPSRPPRNNHANNIIDTEEAELQLAIQESKKLQEEAIKMRSQLPPVSEQQKPSVGGFDDINIDEDELSHLQEELKEEAKGSSVAKVLKTTTSEENAEDEEKRRQDLIRKGMKAMKIESSNDQDMEEKRRNIMAGIRDAIMNTQ